jgi:predicted DNA-binding protein YlxM (UPF0122 family)
MNRNEFRVMEVPEQVSYINKYMAEGKSLSAICKEIGMSKSISEKFKHYGYVLQDNQYILQQIEGQESIFNEPKKVIEQQNVKRDINVPLKQNKALKTVTEGIKEVNRVKTGRPQIHEKDESGKNINTHKLTIEIDKEVARALQHYKVDQEGFKINQFIEDLIKANVPEKYFK